MSPPVMTKFSVTLLLTFITISLTFKTITARKTFAVTEVNGDHCVFNDDGYLRGICVDLWRRIAGDLGIDHEWKVVPGNGAIPAFKNETVEVVDIIVLRLNIFMMKTFDVSK